MKNWFLIFIKLTFDLITLVYYMVQRSPKPSARQKFARADKIVDAVGPSGRQKFGQTKTLSSYLFIHYMYTIFYFTKELELCGLSLRRLPLFILYFFVTAKSSFILKQYYR